MDVLANVLAVTRLGNSVLNQSELLPPWGLDVDRYAIAAVHVVQQGRCWLRTGDEHRQLDAGDLVLVARGVRHQLLDSPRGRAMPYEPALAAMRARIAAGERSDRAARILCMAFEFPFDGPHPLLSVLPPVIHLPRALVARDERLRLLMDLLALEAGSPQSGSSLVVPRLVDAVLVLVVRTWLAQQPAGRTGWVGALRDPLVGRALELMHANPAQPWAIEDMARTLATSRATLARRFGDTVGSSPAAYLAQWRMTVAAQRLRDTDQTLEQIAAATGYQGAASLSKAFRRHFGSAPGTYRDSARRINHLAPGAGEAGHTGA